MMAEQTRLADKFTKLQEATEKQTKVIEDMVAEHKVQQKTAQKTRQLVTAITTTFPLKSELQKMEAEVNADNEQKYVSAITMLLEGNTAKNLEKIFTRELCMEFNANGVFGEKRLRNYKNVYNVVLAAVHQYSPEAEKELKTALQVVKKRRFRAAWSMKQKSGQLNSNA